MKRLPHSQRNFLFVLLFPILASACGTSTPTGVKTDDVRGTWSGTFVDFSLMGRSLSGDMDWTFTRDTFEIIFFDPPEDQAERIEGDWKFTDGKIALVLKSSFPIDTDIGATDTLFISILRDEMSLKTIAESSILLVKTRLALTSGKVPILPTWFAESFRGRHSVSPSFLCRRSLARAEPRDELCSESSPGLGLAFANIRIPAIAQHPPI